MAFRESAEQASEGFKNIRLRWGNKATNFGCTAVEANYSPEGAATELGGTWDLVETILDPAVSEFLHVAVPRPGRCMLPGLCCQRAGTLGIFQPRMPGVG